MLYFLLETIDEYLRSKSLEKKYVTFYDLEESKYKGNEEDK